MLDQQRLHTRAHLIETEVRAGAEIEDNCLAVQIAEQHVIRHA